MKHILSMEEPPVAEKGFYLIIKQKEIPKSIEKICQWDEKGQFWLAPPKDYDIIIESLGYHDILSVHTPISFKITSQFTLRDYQNDAFDAWKRNNFQGVVVLPTGTGKSFLALKAIAEIRNAV